MSLDLITAVELGALLAVSATDANLVRLVSGANDGIKRATGREFEHASRIEVVRGYGRNYVRLRESPIEAITDVRFDTAGKFGSGTSVPDLTLFAFELDPFKDDCRVQYLGGIFPDCQRAAQVTYMAGFYPTTDTDSNHASRLVPEKLRSELIDLVAGEYKRGLGERYQSERLGDYSYTRASADFHAQIEKIAAPFKRY